MLSEFQAALGKSQTAWSEQVKALPQHSLNAGLQAAQNYLGGEAPTATLNFSKGSSTALMQYYMFLRFGREGYTRVIKYALEHAVYLRDRLTKAGKFQIMNKIQRIPVVALALDESVKRYHEFDISNKVRERGWVLSAYTMPPDAQEINSLRIVVRPHLNQDLIEILALDSLCAVY